MTSYQFLVENIKCAGCINKIKENLQTMKGVMGVEVIEAEQKVCVSGIGISRDFLASSLSKLGYPETGHNNIFQRARSFVTCKLAKGRTHYQNKIIH